MAEEIDLDLPDKFDVAIVTIVRCAGVDRADASDRARQAIGRTLGSTLPLPHRNQGVVRDQEVLIIDVMDVGMAAGNGYLWLQPTSKAQRERGLEPL